MEVNNGQQFIRTMRIGDRDCVIGFRFYENLSASPGGSLPKDNVVMVYGYREPYFMGQNEGGDWEFFSAVPEEVARVEDDDLREALRTLGHALSRKSEQNSG
ncbi:MAG: hypothetical protein EOP50_08250 [Sphingobacteriales bacterium]|nr:MAG: hypothetical protein EOP50_08250 [Sphingobacteriales bacterium]